MRAPATVGVDGDLAAGQAGVALRPADDENIISIHSELTLVFCLLTFWILKVQSN